MKSCASCGVFKPDQAFVPDSNTCVRCASDSDTDLQVKREALERQRVREEAHKRGVNGPQIQSEHERVLEAQREQASRILARRHLLHFIKRFDKRYTAGWVHEDICARLERFVKAIERGESPRLMLFMPPRAGKSIIGSDFFPSWALGHHPDWEIIASSYAVSLPITFSRRVRTRLRDDAYLSLFSNTELDPEHQNVEAWSTTMGGGYVAAGIGGPISGKGADILIIDDPVKNAEEADSETIRETAWDWYSSTAYTRLSPGGGVLIIQTRWHDADLSGKLIQQQIDLIKEGAPADEIDNWEVVSYPAIATADEYRLPDHRIVHEAGPGAVLLRKKGEALHPARFNLPRLKRIKATLQPRHWSALYQQNPVPDEGVYFTKGMFITTPALPIARDLRIFSAWDLAIGEKQVNDWTVGVIGGLDYDDRLYVLDMVRGRWNTYDIVDAMLRTAVQHKVEVMGIERGQLEQAIRPVLEKEMAIRKVVVTLDETLTPINDKQSRARPLQGMMQQHRVIFPHYLAWYEDVTHEFLRFPGGVHDDIVDALAWLARMSLKLPAPQRPVSKSDESKSWKRRLKEHINGTKSAMAA